MSDFSHDEEVFTTGFNGKTVLRMLGAVRPYWRRMVLFIGMVSLVAVGDGFFTYLNKKVIDEAIMVHDATRLWTIGGFFLGIMVLQSLCVFGMIYFAGTLGERVQYDLRKKMFDHLQALSFSYYDRTPVGWIMARVTSDSGRIAGLITWGILDVCWAVTNITSSTVFMFTIDWRLAAIVFVAIPFLVIVAVQFKNRIVAEYRTVRRINSKITASYNENITGVRVVKALGREDRNLQEFSGLTGDMRAAGYRAAWLSALFLPVVQIISAVAIGAIAWVGGLQARWGIISVGGIQAFLGYVTFMLWPVQSILLDGHFVLEHGGRNRSGCFFNFNGTSGVWRRTAIVDAGGWQHDTLTEDLDLSYRAQLRGWQFLFLPGLVTPAEVPVEMNAFKLQQHRWAKESIQTCRKVLPLVLQADLPLKVKVEAFFHLTANFNYLLMVVLSVLMFPAMVVRYNMGWYEMLLIDVPLFAAATLSVFNFYLMCQREIYPDWRSRVKYLPVVMAIGIGLAVNNTKAVFEALFGKPGEFARTPKYGIERSQDGWQGKKYHQSMPIQAFIELALGLYFTGTVIYALAHDIYGTLPFLVLFQFGFLYTGLMSIFQQAGGDDLFVKAPQIAGGK